MVTIVINHHSYLYPNGQPNNLDLRPLLSVTHEEHLQVWWAIIRNILAIVQQVISLVCARFSELAV